MKAPQILLISNLLFIKLHTQNNFINSKKIYYMAGTVSGQVFPDDVSEYEDIIAQYAQAQPVNSFLELQKAYDKL